MFPIKKTVKYYILIVLFIIATLTYYLVLCQSPGNLLEVNFFNVGQGDSIFIETPNKKQILIDGGPDDIVLEKLGQEMSFWDRYIDLVVLTHPDWDHITGLVSVLDRFEVGQILVSGAQKDSAVYKEWQAIVKEKNIPLKLAQKGQAIILDKGVYLEILWPEQPLSNSLKKKTNNASVVGRLVYNKAEFLLSGDIEKNIENKLISQNVTLRQAQGINYLESDVLKMAHHGSKYSSSQDFIESVGPKISVISVGKDNYYGHPHGDTLERLKETLIYRTDRDGDIRITTDGLLLTIEK